MDKSFVKDKIPSTVLELIGEITVNFAFLQQGIMDTISKSTSIDSALIDRLIGRDNFEPLISKLNNCVIYVLNSKKLLTTELHEEFDDIIKKITKVKEQRNELLHNFIFPTRSGEIIMLGFKYRVGKDLIYSKSANLNENFLTQLNNDIIDIFQILMDFNEKIIKLFSSSMD